MNTKYPLTQKRDRQAKQARESAHTMASLIITERRGTLAKVPKRRKHMSAICRVIDVLEAGQGALTAFSW